MRSTLFHAVLSRSTLNEFRGITQNDCGCIEIKQLSDRLPTSDYLPIVICITPKEDLYLHQLIGRVYRTDLIYHFKSNSINFNIEELPFQTYEGWLEPEDAESVISKIPNKSINQLEELITDLVNWHPEDRVRYFLNQQLEAIADDDGFVADQFFSSLNNIDQLPDVYLDRKDLSRLYNQMMYIWAYIDSLESGKEFVSALIKHNRSLATLNRLRNS